MPCNGIEWESSKISFLPLRQVAAIMSYKDKYISQNIGESFGTNG